MADSHCEDVRVLDLRALSQVTDYFVIGSGTSDRQIRSVGGELERMGREQEQPIHGMHGKESGRWLVVDFVDVVAHLFSPDQREYYDLESLWGDAPRIDWASRLLKG